MKKYLVLLILFAIEFNNYCHAQSIRGGEMTIVYQSLEAINLQIELYSQNEPRPNILINWGDGSESNMMGSAYEVEPNILINYYSGSHAYVDTGYYIISMSEDFLLNDIENIEFSSTKSFDLSDTVLIRTGTNNVGPLYLSYETEVDNIDGSYIHNLSTYDLEGDSIAYFLQDFPSDGYTLPTFTDSLVVNNSGQIIWSKPIEKGIYGLAIKGKEYRGNTLISTKTRALVFEIDSVATSIEHIINSLQLITFFPNPTSEYIYIINDEIVYLQNTKTFNYLGEEVLISFNKFNCAYVGNLVPGMYFTTINTNSGLLIYKWIKI